MKDLRFMANQAQTVLELTKGFTPEQRDNFSNALLTAEEMASYVLEMDQQNSQLSEALKQCKEALERVQPDATIPEHLEAVKAAKEALETLKKLGIK